MPHQPLYGGLGFLLHDVARLLRRQFDQQGPKSGLTRAQWHVLVYLKRHEGINQTGLADMLEMEPITLSRHVDRMEAAGWVERRADPTDRRARRLYLGKRVEALLEEMHPVARMVFAEALAGLSASDIENLVRMLNRIKDNLCARTDGETERPAAHPGSKTSVQEGVA